MPKVKMRKKANIDVQIAAGTAGMVMFNPQFLEQIKQMLGTAKDVVQVCAHMLYMILHMTREKLQQKGIDIDQRVWIAGGGVLDRVMFDFMGILYSALNFQEAGNPKFVAAVKEAVLNLMHDNENAQDGEEQEGSPDEEAQETPEQEQQEQQGGGLLAPQQTQPSAGQQMRGP